MSQQTHVDVGGVAVGEMPPRDAANEAIYHITHDLSAPVKALSMLAEWIAEDIDPAAGRDPAITQHLGDMKVQTARLDRMLKDLLTYSRVGRPPEPATEIALRDVIAETVLGLGLERRFIVRLALGVTHLRVPQRDFETLLGALIDNVGRHHDQARGVLTITSHLLPDRVCLRVADDGPGIDERFHDRIFDLMTTLQPRDQVDTSGVGLAVARKVVASMGGTIRVMSSSHRRGSVFEVVLPARYAASAPQNTVVASEPLPDACPRLMHSRTEDRNG